MIKLIQLIYVNLVAPVDLPRDIVVVWKIPTWARQTLQKVEGYVPLHGTFQVRKIPHRYSCYATTMSHIIHLEPSCHEEETSHPGMERCHDGGVSIHHEE
jgi:hypothetical protein